MAELEDYGIDHETVQRMYDEWVSGAPKSVLERKYGDPHDEVLGAWLAKESVRDVFLAVDPADAEVLPARQGHRRLPR